MAALSGCRAGFGLGVAVVACCASWLVLGDSSPLKEYFLYHVSLPNLLGTLYAIPYLVVIVVRPRTQSTAGALSWVLIFSQWLLTGFLLSFLICGGRGKARPLD